ncbi:G-protein-signaling modulator 1 isoform X2 [Hemicordylus capensis]|uniref:G-protein-signaling modulator 1 isoform X2 n=1 Tax=Hemicordylus capensis TaxID=884348 RepID=UPI002303C0D4|nr:G-protein-signaling modulator 1 isoform X2 [Hemicordylus capensis]
MSPPSSLGARPKWSQRASMSSFDLLRFPSEKDQNGENHPVGELKIARKDFLSLPVRANKCRDHQAVWEGRPLVSGESPLETTDVQVQVSPLKLQRAPSEEECFFDLLSKFQSARMDDQRCTLEDGQKEPEEEATATPVPALEERTSQSSSMASPQTEALFDLIASSQSRRLDDQRASVGSLPGLRITHNNRGHLRMEGDAQQPGDEFFNMLMKCQSSRIDDQRCAPPNALPPRGPTVPDEDFFSLIQRVQAKRMDEQRVDLASAQEKEEEEEEEEEQQGEEGQPGRQQSAGSS